jgi:hypothetical protein
VIVVTTGTLATVAIVTADGVNMTRNVSVILMVVITATAIGAGVPLLAVIRPTIAGAGVTPEALLEAAAQLVRQGTMMAPMKAPAGKFASYYLSTWRFVGVHPWVPDDHLWQDKVKVLQARKVSVSKSNLRVVPKFAFLSVHTTIVRKVSS